MRGWTTAMLAVIALGACERERSTEPLVVRKAEPAPELDLATKVRGRLADDPLLSPAARRVRVIVEDGIVTLRGTVASEQERSRVDRLATEAAGDAMVRDELEVIAVAPPRSPPPPTAPASSSSPRSP